MGGQLNQTATGASMGLVASKLHAASKPHAARKLLAA
jgi:hypothetical protein